MTTATRSYYPVFLDLDGRLTVVVGDGSEAAARADALREVGARVRVVASRSFRPGDLEGASLAIALADDATNEAVRAAATLHRVPLNVVDRPARCDWIHGAVLRRGGLVVAISTSGAAPALAVRIKERLANDLGPEYGRFLELAAEQRGAVSGSGLSFAARRRVWYRLVDSGALAALRAEDARADAIFAAELAAALADEAAPRIA